MHFKLSELIAKFGGELIGEDVQIDGVATTNLAKESQLTFVSDNKYKKDLATCKASAIILSHADAALSNLPRIIVNNPYYYFSLISNLFYPRRLLKPGIAKSATIEPSVIIADNVAISHNVVIEANSNINSNCQIFTNVVIGENVSIGKNTIIYPNVTIYDKVAIGENCVIHSGAIIGSDGFGNAQDQHKHYHRIPQIGGVIIGNNVEIGANTTIDCGTFEATVIEDGVRIDNLVQIAHNVRIGAHTGIAAQVGIAGGTKIGKHCMLGGQVAIIGHISICDYTAIGACSNVSKNINTPALYSSALPNAEYKEWAKTVVYIRNLDKTNSILRELQTKVQLLEGASNE